MVYFREKDPDVWFYQNEKGETAMRNRIILTVIALAILVAAAVPAHAAVFQYGSLVIAGDGENTYAYDAKIEEGKQIDRVFYSPPAGNFCAYKDKIYFDADNQLVEYSPESGKYKRIGSVGNGFSPKAVFAGILEDRLYFTVSEGYLEDKYNLKYLDIATGEIKDLLSNVYDACVWEGKIFVALARQDQEHPDQKIYYFGELKDNLSSMKIYTKNAVYPEKPAGRLMWGGPDALYFQEYAFDTETGERAGVFMRKAQKDPENSGSFNLSTYGTIHNPQAQMEYLGISGEYLFFRIRYPGNESENRVIMQSLSDDILYDITFNGKTNNQYDADLFFSDGEIYYSAEDGSLWQLELSEGDDHLIGHFPQETIFQGVTETDIFYICGGTLYCTPLAELKQSAAAREKEEPADPDILIKEIEEGLRKAIDICTPSPFLRPEILKNNPQIETWLQEADGKNLRAGITLGSGIELSAEKEGRDIQFRFRAEGEEKSFRTALPEGITDGKLIKTREWKRADMLDRSRITREEGICDLGYRWSDAEKKAIKTEIPCRIYHGLIRWQTAAEMMQDLTSALSGLYEDLSIDGVQFPDFSGQIASLEALAGDGISVDFYITDTGCIRIAASILKSPRVTGANGGTPEIKMISDSNYTAGLKWSVTLQQDQRVTGISEDRKVKADVSLTMQTEVSSGSIPARSTSIYSFAQYEEYGTYHENFSFSFSGGSNSGIPREISGGTKKTEGSFILLYNPDNTAVLSFNARGDSFGNFVVRVRAPEISGSRILIPFTAETVGSLPWELPRSEGSLVLEYLEP